MVYPKEHVSNRGLTVFFASAAVLAAAAAVIECSSAHSNTVLLLASRHSPALKEMGLINVAVSLVLAVVAYGICSQIEQLRRPGGKIGNILAQLEQKITAEFCIDLLLKFSFLAVLIGGNVPFYFAAVLLLFTGHYLIRGYFSAIPQHIASAMGIVYCAIGMILAITGYPYLLMPLAAFSAAAATDVYFRRSATQ